MSLQKVRVLVVDDDRNDFELLQRRCRKFESLDLDLVLADSYGQGMRAIQEPGFDVALDFRLGALTGTQFIGEARAGGVSTPMILLTGYRDPSIDLAASKAGAVQFVEKGADPSLLERAIRYAVAHRQAGTSMRVLEDVDRLTQLLLTVGPTTDVLAQVVHSLHAEFGNLPVALYLADGPSIELEVQRGLRSPLDSLDPTSGPLRTLVERGKPGTLPMTLFEADGAGRGAAWCAPLSAGEACFGLLVCGMSEDASGGTMAGAVRRMVAPLTSALSLQLERGLSFRQPYDRSPHAY